MKYYCIVPVYNSEDKVDSFLSEIRKQSIFEEVTFIVVNDGSKDNTFLLLTDKTSKNDNIILLNKENGGAGSARNYGLKYISTLEEGLVTFLDFDDKYDNKLLETLRNFVMINNVDAAITSVKKCYDNKETLLSPNKINSETIYNVEDFKKLFIEEKIFPCSMGKIFKTFLWKNVFFDEFCSIGEDTPAIFNALCNSKKVFCSPYCGYFLDRKSENSSLTRGKYSNHKYLSIIHSSYLINEILINRKENAYLLETHASIFADNFFGVVCLLNKPICNNDKNELLFLKKYFKKYVIKLFKPNNKKERTKKIIFKLFGVRGYRFFGKILKIKS